MTKRNASELAVVGASSDARFGERQSAHQRESARYARFIDDLNLDRGRAVALLSGTYARLGVGAPAPPLAPLAPVELQAFNGDVHREYVAREFWREDGRAHYTRFVTADGAMINIGDFVAVRLPEHVSDGAEEASVVAA